MRILFSILLLLVPILGVYTFVIAPEYGWWFPPLKSTFASVDQLFYLILWMVTITFVATEVMLFWFVFRYSRRDSSKASFTHGNHKLEMVWTGIPAILLLAIAFSQMGAWAEIKFKASDPGGNYSAANPLAELTASQFDWRARYPGDDGILGTADDLENPFEFVVPVDEKVVFLLRSRDVIHSFFVPHFRLKQDALPGHTIPVWFQATEVGEYDLICAELCGWGHYKMAGRVTVLSREDYDAWLEDLKADWYSNGTEDNS